MLPDRQTRLRELAIVLKWLRHKQAVARVSADKYSALHVQVQSSLSYAMMEMYTRRYDHFKLLIGHVELDIKTLASHGKAEGTKGRNNK